MEQLSTLVWLFIGGAIYFIACAGFGAYVADQKGRSRLEGMLFGFVLGPFGVVAEGTLPTLKPKLSTTNDEEDDEWGKEIARRIAEQYQPQPGKPS
jgi:hypothetical protein